jgi:ribonucleoside-diphosphate reductase alpha chain
MSEIKLSENQMKVLEKRYLMKDENRKVVETPEQMFRRVANNIAQAERLYIKEKKSVVEKKVNETADMFYEILSSLDALPNTPCLVNAGREIQQLSACFVIEISDSLDGIFKAIYNAAMIFRTGGGVGYSFSRLRPKDAVVSSTMGTSSGPISFMRAFNAATEVIKQGGVRRGANMGVMRVDHPDIMEFIHCKDQPGELENFNISVALTHKFMEAVDKNEDYELIAPHTKKVMRKLNAKKVFDEIVKSAWEKGDPGAIFIDRINEFNPTPEVGEIESTNPCGEIPLLPGESCNLMSINLLNHIHSKQVNWVKLEGTTRTCVRFLDNVIDMNKYPLGIIEEMSKANRKIGVGVMGFADVLIKLGIPYNSEKAIALAKKIMKFIDEKAKEMSIELGKERGSFPNFGKSVYKGECKHLRNATRTMIAPTGSIGMIAGVSGGIEPLFGVTWVKKVMEGTEIKEVHPLFKEIAEKEGFYTDELGEEISKTGTLKNNDKIPRHIQDLFVCAHDISPEWHVRMQAAFQEYVNNSISKTINCRNSATVDDVARAYLLAYNTGCKGITVFRDGSKADQVYYSGNKVKAEEKEEDKIKTPVPRPDNVPGETRRIKTGCGNLFISLGVLEDKLFETIIRLGKSGGCATAYSEALGRLISLCLRSGINYSEIVEQLSGIRCPLPISKMEGHGKQVLSCPDAIGIVVEEYLQVLTKGKVKIKTPEPKVPVRMCPECNSILVAEEKCLKCTNPACGYSVC